MRSLEQRISKEPLPFIGLWLKGRNRAQKRARRCSGHFREGSPTCRIWCLIICSGADIRIIIITIEIKCTTNAMHLNHTETIPWPWLVEKFSPMKLVHAAKKTIPWPWLVEELSPTKLVPAAKRPLVLGIWEGWFLSSPLEVVMNRTAMRR